MTQIQVHHICKWLVVDTQQQWQQQYIWKYYNKKEIMMIMKQIQIQQVWKWLVVGVQHQQHQYMLHYYNKEN